MVVVVLPTAGWVAIGYKVSAIISNRPRTAQPNPWPFLKIFRNLPIAQSLRCVSIFKLHVDGRTFFFF
jgi:hypothetical protein